MKDAYYFSHDSNARHDPKIVKLLSKYPIGYQWYFMLIEILREQDEYRYKLDDFSYNAIAYELHTDCITIESFLHDCINNFNLLKSDNEYFWSESLLNRMMYFDVKKDKMRKNANKRWAEYRKNKELSTNDNTKAMQLHSKSNASKVKESKVNKVKEINTEIFSDPIFNNLEFKEIWDKWVKFRKEIKKPLTPTSIESQIKKLKKYNIPTACQMLQQSIENSWSGIFDIKGKQNGNSNNDNFAEELRNIRNIKTPFAK